MYVYTSEDTFLAMVNRKGHPVTTAGHNRDKKHGRETHVIQRVSRQYRAGVKVNRKVVFSGQGYCQGIPVRALLHIHPCTHHNQFLESSPDI